MSASIAVLIPCFNEAPTVAKVVADFKRALPSAVVYVFDNRSTDQTAALAEKAGAAVVRSERPGKGYVVRHMFEAVEADVYVMVDGDGTYPAARAPELVAELVAHRADMVVATRLRNHDPKAFRGFHMFGNRLVAALISNLFECRITDVLSGYRVFSRSFVKSVPLLSKGFDIETEMTLQAVDKDFLIREVPVEYGRRPEGSFSKLNTYSDGIVVLRSILTIFKDYKPLAFFGALGAASALLCLWAGMTPIEDYVQSRYVYHVPLAILASALAVLATLSFSVGIILDTVCKYHRELFELQRKAGASDGRR